MRRSYLLLHESPVQQISRLIPVLACRIQDFSIDDDAHSADDTTPLQTSQNSVDLHVGVLHYSPGQECFPLLKDPAAYTPDTSDLNNAEQRDYWIQVLKDQLPTVVEKAISTDGSTPGNL